MVLAWHSTQMFEDMHVSRVRALLQCVVHSAAKWHAVAGSANSGSVALA